MAADLTRFDFHVVRFLYSYDVERMTAEEVGQYILLLCRAWLAGKDTLLPDDLSYLAKQARVKKISPLVLSKFPIVDTPEGKMRRNNALYGEWLVAKDRSASASERGTKGNEVRWEKRNSLESTKDNRSSDPLAIEKISPKPIQTNSNQSKPNNISSVSFAPGTYGRGDFKNMSLRWYSRAKKPLSKTKQNREQYGDACALYSEDVVLKYLDPWFDNNDWVISHPKGGNRLYVFLRDLPEMIEGDQISAEREQAVQKVNDVDAEIVANIEKNLAKEREEIAAKIKQQQDEDHRANETAYIL